jgi:hypothetical protein
MVCGGVDGCICASMRVIMASKAVPSISCTTHPPIPSIEVVVILNHGCRL